MINTINSNSLTLQTDLWKKLSVTKSANELIASSNDSSDQSFDSSVTSNTGKKVISIEDLIGLMQRYKNNASAYSSSQTDTTSTDTTATASAATAATATDTTDDTLADAVTTAATDTSTDSTLSSIDADGDGTISEDEYNQLISQLGIEDAPTAEEFFKLFDTNSDGELSTDELNSANEKIASSMASTQQNPPVIPPDIDTDGDGSLSSDEYDTLISQLDDEDALSAEDFFKEYDTNSDGEITADEVIAGLNNAAQSVTNDTTTDSTDSTDSTTDDSSSVSSTTDDTTTNDTTSSDETVESMSLQYQNLAAKVLSAYETNYDFMFGQENSNIDIF